MAKERKNQLSDLMRLAWQMVRKNGYTMSEALRCAWVNIKLRAAMRTRIVKFYFQKVDGTMREAFGTLADSIIPAVAGTDTRKKNDTIQTYYDTEKGEWRCYKKANLLKIA